MAASPASPVPVAAAGSTRTLYETLHRAYNRIGDRLGRGRVPEAPHPDRSLVVVPVSSLSRLTSDALTAAAPLGDEVRAVAVCYSETEDRAQTHASERSWAEWNQCVDPVRSACERRGLGRPIAAYVRERWSPPRPAPGGPC